MCSFVTITNILEGVSVFSALYKLHTGSSFPECNAFCLFESMSVTCYLHVQQNYHKNVFLFIYVLYVEFCHQILLILAKTSKNK